MFTAKWDNFTLLFGKLLGLRATAFKPFCARFLCVVQTATLSTTQELITLKRSVYASGLLPILRPTSEQEVARLKHEKQKN